MVVDVQRRNERARKPYQKRRAAHRATTGLPP